MSVLRSSNHPKSNPNPTTALQVLRKHRRVLLELAVDVALVLGAGATCGLATQAHAAEPEPTASPGVELPGEPEIHAAQCLAADGSELPTDIQSPKGPEGRPIIPCKQCTSTTKKVAAADGSTIGADVGMVYESDDGSVFDGPVEIRGDLGNGEDCLAFVGDIEIASGQAHWFALDQEHCSWDEVTSVTIWLLPSPTPGE